MAVPTLLRRATSQSGTTNSTSWTAAWTWSLNTVIASGTRVRWYAIVSADGDTTLSASGWTKLHQFVDSSGVAVTAALFFRDTTVAYGASANPGLSLSSTVSEQYSAVLYAFAPGTGQEMDEIWATATAAVANSDPPALTNNTGAARDFYCIVSRHGDGTVAATVAPGTFTDLMTASNGGAAGAVTNTAQRTVTYSNGVTYDPGTFTNAVEQASTQTIGIFNKAMATITGSGGDTFDPMTGTGAGEVSDAPIVGGTSPEGITLAPLTGSGEGGTSVAGQGGGTFAPVTGTGAASLSISGTASQTFAPMAGAAAGGSSISGTASRTFAPLTGSGTGGTSIDGSGGGTFVAMTGAGAGSLSIGGLLASTFAPLDGTSSASLSISGSGGGTFDPVTGQGAASLFIGGVGGGTFALLLGEGMGETVAAGSLAATFSALLSAASADLILEGGLGATFAPLTLYSVQEPPVDNSTPPERSVSSIAGRVAGRKAVAPVWSRITTAGIAGNRTASVPAIGSQKAEAN